MNLISRVSVGKTHSQFPILKKLKVLSNPVILICLGTKQHPPHSKTACLYTNLDPKSALQCLKNGSL